VRSRTPVRQQQKNRQTKNVPDGSGLTFPSGGDARRARHWTREFDNLSKRVPNEPMLAKAKY